MQGRHVSGEPQVADEEIPLYVESQEDERVLRLQVQRAKAARGAALFAMAVGLMGLVLLVNPGTVLGVAFLAFVPLWIWFYVRAKGAAKPSPYVVTNRRILGPEFGGNGQALAGIKHVRAVMTSGEFQYFVFLYFDGRRARVPAPWVLDPGQFWASIRRSGVRCLGTRADEATYKRASHTR